MIKINKKIRITLLIALFGPVVAVFSGIAQARQCGKIYVVQIRGTDVGEMRMVSDIDDDGKPDEAMCFDIDMVNPNTNMVIGTATDCLSNITPVGDGLALIGTTYFNFKEGTLVTRGKTTVQPTTHASETVTHITSAVPSGSNDIVAGTGVFTGATGSVRLSGLVDLSKKESEGKITFDCIFVITLD